MAFFVIKYHAHSRDQQLYKFLKQRKETRNEFNPHWSFFGTSTWPPFTVLYINMAAVTSCKNDL